MSAKANMLRASELDLKEKVVSIRRVAKVTKGGRTFGFSALVVVGDGNGVVGHGMGKAREVTEAIQKAIDDAKKSLVKVPILKGTIPHEQIGKFGAAKVLMRPASEGTKSVRAEEYLNPSTPATLRLTILYRFGPTLFDPPASKL